VVRANASGDGKLELLGFGETLGSEVARVETVVIIIIKLSSHVTVYGGRHTEW
jgi:hypothetical protein